MSSVATQAARSAPLYFGSSLDEQLLGLCQLFVLALHLGVETGHARAQPLRRRAALLALASSLSLAGCVAWHGIRFRFIVASRRVLIRHSRVCGVVSAVKSILLVRAAAALAGARAAASHVRLGWRLARRSCRCRGDPHQAASRVYEGASALTWCG